MATVDVVLMNGPEEGHRRTEQVDDNGLPPAEIRVLAAAADGVWDRGKPPPVYVYRRGEQHSGVWWYAFERRRVAVQ